MQAARCTTPRPGVLPGRRSRGRRSPPPGSRRCRAHCRHVRWGSPVGCGVLRRGRGLGVLPGVAVGAAVAGRYRLQREGRAGQRVVFERTGNGRRRAGKPGERGQITVPGGLRPGGVPAPVFEPGLRSGVPCRIRPRVPCRARPGIEHGARLGVGTAGGRGVRLPSGGWQGSRGLPGGADRQALGHRLALVALVPAGQVTRQVAVGRWRPGRTGIPRGGLGLGAAIGRRLGCRIARGLARPRHGRKRLVGGNLGPVLLVGELVPFRARPVVVIVALAPLPGPALAAGRSGRRLAPRVLPVPGAGCGGLHRGLVTGRVAPGRAEVHGRVIGRGEVVSGGPLRGTGVITAAGLSGRPDRGASSGRTARFGGFAGAPRCAVVVPAPRRPGLGARTVARVPSAAAGRRHPPGVPVPPALVLVAPPVAAAGPQVTLVMLVTAPEPNAQKDGNEDHYDYGRQANHEQDHRTTQLAMAIWAALARRTRPRRGPSPVSLAAWDHSWSELLEQ